MTELMRGAGSSEARISPDQHEDEPDLLAPDVAAARRAPRDRGARPRQTPRRRDQRPNRPPAPGRPGPGRPASRGPAKPTAQPAATRRRRASPPPNLPQSRLPGADPRGKPARKPDRRKARQRAPRRSPCSAPAAPRRNAAAARYLGLVLTLLLLLVMAVIALWSSFFVDDGDPALFNPGEEAAPVDPRPGPGRQAPGQRRPPIREPTAAAPDTQTRTPAPRRKTCPPTRPRRDGDARRSGNAAHAAGADARRRPRRSTPRPRSGSARRKRSPSPARRGSRWARSAVRAPRGATAPAEPPTPEPAARIAARTASGAQHRCRRRRPTRSSSSTRTGWSARRPKAR